MSNENLETEVDTYITMHTLSIENNLSMDAHIIRLVMNKDIEYITQMHSTMDGKYKEVLREGKLKVALQCQNARDHFRDTVYALACSLYLSDASTSAEKYKFLTSRITDKTQ